MSEEAKNPPEGGSDIEKINAAASATGGEGENQDSELSPEQKLIKELQDGKVAAEKRAEEAEKRAREESQRREEEQKRASTAFETSVKSTEDKIKSQVEESKSKFENAKRVYREAYDSGDPDKLLDAQIGLNEAQNRVRAAEYAQEQFGTWKENQKNQTQVSSTSRFTPAEQEWIDKHPKFNTDRRYRAAVYAADEEAREKGIVIDSPEYFRHLETYLVDVGLEKDPSASASNNNDTTKRTETEEKTAPEKIETQTQTQKKNSASTAAPPGGSSGSTKAGKVKTITLTPEMREAAAFTFPDLYKKDPKAAEEKYANYQLKIQEDKAKGVIK